MTEFDLDNPPAGEDDESPAARRRRARREKDGDKKPTPTARRVETNLVERLNRAFGKIADQLRIRGDHELADALDEDKDAMSHGFVSLTGTFKFLRNPLVWFISLVEPVLAFWHVGGILLRRMFAWRERVVVEAAEYPAPEEPSQTAVRLG